MRVSVADRLEIADTAPTGDGYLAVNAKVARLGMYRYARAEIGDTEGDPNELVNVWRSEDEVFDKDAMASFAHKPITLNHPRDAVDKTNWRQHSRGMSGGRVARVGDFLEIPMVVNDGDAIKAIENGVRELSAGYSADIVIGDGVAPNGETYRAVMQNIRGNHIAIVDRGRAGSQCRIGDAAWEAIDSVPPKKETLKLPHIMHDGLKIDLNDAEAVSALVTKLTDSAEKADAAKVVAEKALTDAEVAHASALKDANDAKDKAEAEAISAKKALDDAKITPEQLRDAAKAYAVMVDAAAKIAPDFVITDAMSEADIRKGVVLAKFGDSYAGKSDSFFDALFEVESNKVADAKPEEKSDAFRDAMANRSVVDFADAAGKAKTARDKMIAGFNAPREAVK